MHIIDNKIAKISYGQFHFMTPYEGEDREYEVT